MFKKKITTEDEEFVTKGYLRQEFEKFAELIVGKIMGEIQGLRMELAGLENRFQKNTDIVVGELKAVRAEMKEFRQAKDVLERNDVVQERKIDALDERVLSLEIARK